MRTPKNYIQLELFDFSKLEANDMVSDITYDTYFTEVDYSWADSPYESVTLAELDAHFSSIPEFDVKIEVPKVEVAEAIEYHAPHSAETEVLKRELAELTKTLYAQYTRVKDLNAEIDDLKKKLEQQSKK